MKKEIKNILEGELSAKGARFAVICSRFNEFFVSKLLDGAVDAITRHGGKTDDIAVAWVPGSAELPLAAAKLAETGSYDAVITLGVVIQGATPHASHIATEVGRALGKISLDNKIPVINGLVTANNIEQAIERSGTKAGNRGAAAALAAIEMVSLLKSI